MHNSLPGSWYLAGGQTGERQVMGKVGSAARDQRVNMLQGLHKEGLAYMTIMCMGNRRSSYAPYEGFNFTNQKSRKLVVFGQRLKEGILHFIVVLINSNENEKQKEVLVIIINDLVSWSQYFKS